ncbi:MAG: leucine-rich repeat protein [Candidatus Lokiarchaeota archaeon]|nr:leucine-rich repeat protein [Candidatus Lokiarchaeota archaeon]
MDISLMYTDEVGRERVARFDRTVKEIDLSDRGVKVIDLSPLSSCSSLKKLSLSDNQLEGIDLYPLSSCTSLQILRIDRNKLQRIDLSPLSSCTSLETLEVDIDTNLEMVSSLYSQALPSAIEGHREKLHIIERPFGGKELESTTHVDSDTQEESHSHHTETPPSRKKVTSTGDSLETGESDEAPQPEDSTDE